MADKPPLKILCIHGYRQNAQLFREKTGSFRKVIKKYADLVFITAPNQVPPLSSDKEVIEGDHTGWWFSNLDDSFHAQDRTDCCKGYENSVLLIEKTLKEQGPFDGILGFSQGASMVSLLCGIQEQQPDKKLFNFAILVAGFKSRSSSHDILYSKKISIPTLHVYGESDKIIPKDMSEDLLQYFEDYIVLQHLGGHFIPTGGPQKKIYLEFLEKMRICKAST
ncbi:esterase OVCA2-like isoform X2 [Pomacea canaliculata]|uniref:esterase OVCA2-like isoform X2 n=1 Tax=Pomacea canaliculata TaxID=400727 RepID=UPI000D72832D|nr:esterase OVCA2-like isoform X2 [Pomacea canaliculata]